MLAGHIRLGLVATLAIMFGIVQIMCACLSNVPTAYQASISLASHQVTSDAGGLNQNAITNKADQSAVGHDHGTHNHEADCSNHDNVLVMASNMDISPSVSISSSVYNSLFVSNQAHLSRADMASTNLATLRWVDPPKSKSNPSPVSLKTLSQI